MKKLIYNVITLIVLTVVLSGCSTPITEATGKKVPQDRVYSESLTLPPGDDRYGSITFLRDSGFPGSGCIHVVSVDNEKVFGINPDEYITIYLLPGSYRLKVEAEGALCPIISNFEEVDLEAGESITIRVFVPWHGFPSFGKAS